MNVGLFAYLDLSLPYFVSVYIYFIMRVLFDKFLQYL